MTRPTHPPRTRMSGAPGSLKSTGVAQKFCLWETLGMAKRRKRIPKNGDRVSVRGETGTFVIYGVNSFVQAADMKLIGKDLALSAIPWDALTFLDEEVTAKPLPGS